MSTGSDGQLAIDLNASGKQAPKKKPEKSTFSAGDLVWAKVSGFKFWAARVVDIKNDKFFPASLKVPPKEKCTMVRFFGTYDYHWICPSSIMTYEAGIKKRLQSKCRGISFQAAFKEAKEFRESGTLPAGFMKTTPTFEELKVAAAEQKEEEPEEPDPEPVPKKQKRSKRQDQSNDDSTTPTVEQAAEPVVDKSEKAVRDRCTHAMRRLGLMGPPTNLRETIY